MFDLSTVQGQYGQSHNFLFRKSPVVSRSREASEGAMGDSPETNQVVLDRLWTGLVLDREGAFSSSG